MSPSLPTAAAFHARLWGRLAWLPWGAQAALLHACAGAAWAAAAATSAPQRQRVAVCLRGGLRGGPEVLRSIEQRVLQPLAADVFVYVPLRRRVSGSEGSHSSGEPGARPEELQRLAALPGLVALRAEVEDPTALLEAEVRRRQRHAGPGAAEAVMQATLAVAGSWLGGVEEPAPGGQTGERRLRPGAGLVIMLSWYRCLEAVERAEEIAGGQRYDWIVDTRLDAFWEHPHVPLELLSQDAIWVPEGADYGGLNDRHVVLPRQADDKGDVAGRLSPSAMYLEAWRFVAEGKAALLLHELLAGSGYSVSETGCDTRADGLVDQPCVNSETWLYMRLQAQKVQIKRLPLLSWIACPSRLHLYSSTHAPAQGCRANGKLYQYEREFTEASLQGNCLRALFDEGMCGWSVGGLTPIGALKPIREAIQACWCPKDNHNRDAREQDFFAFCS